jgi:hypothetical protein
MEASRDNVQLIRSLDNWLETFICAILEATLIQNMTSQEETEPIPFPNNVTDFSLPEDLHSPVEKELERVAEKESESDSGTPTSKSAPAVGPDSPKRAIKRLRTALAANSPASPAVAGAGSAGKRRRQVTT